MKRPRELYRSPNGDVWALDVNAANGHAVVLHTPNGPSGGKPHVVGLADFLREPAEGPEHQALLRLVATLCRDDADDFHEAAANGNGEMQ
ncbi:MAG TPA: hypothetical protein VIL72_01895 [Beijerinckiaceae bacterium]|jgi:hypothetical protein